MQLINYLPFALLLTTSSLARKSPESVLLSNVKSLTLRKDLTTSHNRVAAAPQLKCVGGTAKGVYEIDVLRCKNSGSAYGDEDIQWTCSASLPSEFKLGSTEVICEGFKSPDDPYVLKGSCGVEYRLMLTDIGKEKYGRKGKRPYDDYDDYKGSGFVGVLFWVIFIAVVCWMIYAAFLRDDRLPRGGNNRPGFFGGGGGGWGGGNDDPPPPYDPNPPPSRPKTMPRATSAQGGWRPGFWTGALGGAAAGYAAANRGQASQSRNYGPNINYRDNGEGSSRWGGGGSTRSSSGSGSSSSYGSTRHESSGFGGTSRR
ncbi:hypothetical protein ACLMJK_009182 [Lecanora helva]